MLLASLQATFFFYARILIIVSLGCCVSIAVIADTKRYEQQRGLFKQARAAQQANNQHEYQALRRQLDDYPLTPYLDYAKLKPTFALKNTSRINDFLAKHQGTYIAHQALEDWLHHLAWYKHWDAFQTFYARSDNQHSNRNRCYFLQSELALHPKRKTNVMETVANLWLTPRSLPKACDPLLAQLSKTKGFNTLVWQRYQLAYAYDNQRLMNYLKPDLTKTHRALLTKLQDPTTHHDFWLNQLNKQPLANGIISRSIRVVGLRLLQTHLNTLSQWLVEHPNTLEDDDYQRLVLLAAWYYAKHKPEQALIFLAKIKTLAQDDDTQFAKLQYAMQAKRWDLYKRFFITANSNVQSQEVWQYWYAHAQQNSAGAHGLLALKANTLYQNLANSRGFYGILGARAAGVDNILYRQGVESTNQAYRETTALPPAFESVFEWYYLGQEIQANREWAFYGPSLSPTDWASVARFTRVAHWQSRILSTYAKAGVWDALDVRFPRPFLDTFAEQAKQHNIPLSWILAMARQESGFNPNARSHANAKGLLQLLPSTAKNVANALSVPFSEPRLYETDYNIRLGSAYLSQLLASYEHNYILATASYNAGSGRVNEWRALRPNTDDWIHWTATIPYKETRQYVKNIFSYSLIYEKLLAESEGNLDMLSMQDVFFD